MVARTFLPCSKIVKKPLKLEYSQNPQTLGEHIRKKRIEGHQTQLDVAKFIGVDEDTITCWEVGRHSPQAQFYPLIIKYLGYYPFPHEMDSLVGKLLQARYCNGWTCRQIAKILGVDTATIRRWELKKSSINTKHHETIMDLWCKNQYLSN